ncbi:MAG: DUF6569 family protein [Deltaproteobacteria bacterium]|nr:DUF6569 family protein [Deltaproteobacteria bacterium]
MDKMITNFLEQLKVGRKQSYQNLALYPLLSTYNASLEYLLLDEALNDDLIEVVEVDSEGSVPDLKVVNKSPHMILILDGEELVGAKQNRIVNTTILVDRNTTLLIPVSCVEHGRWSYDTPRFQSKKRMMSSNLRARKSEQVMFSVRSEGNYRSDQGAIWDEIADKSVRMEVASPTGAMGAMYEKRGDNTQEYIKNFHLIDYQVGAVFMINGQVVGMDAFGTPDTFSKIFNKLLESYSLDAIDGYNAAEDPKTLKSAVTRFQKASLSVDTTSHQAVGLGMDYRLESKKLTGFALAFNDEILHISIFSKINGNGQRAASSRMARYSQRQRNRTS